MSRAKIGAALLALAAAIASHGAWAQLAALPGECGTPRLRSCLSAEAGTRQECILAAMRDMPDPCRKAISDGAAGRAGPLPQGWREEAYGADPRQKLDWAMPQGASGKAPLLLFVHGGGWAIGDKRSGAGQKGAHFLRRGWAFASTNYRLVPQARVEDQAADIAAAIAYLRRQRGIDAERIVLMGHSAGAHLAALVATDPSYLKAAGVPIGAIQGVVLLDGAGYDVPRQIASRANPVGDMYVQAFGRDPARQRALSPVTHTAAPNARNWLILPVSRRPEAVAQSEVLAARLTAAGAAVLVAPQPGKTHASLNRELGRPGDASTAVVDAFLERL